MTLKKLAEAHLELHKKHGFKSKDYWHHDEDQHNDQLSKKNLSKGSTHVAMAAIGSIPGMLLKKHRGAAIAAGAVAGALAGGPVYRRVQANLDDRIKRRKALMHDLRKRDKIDVWSRGKL